MGITTLPMPTVSRFCGRWIAPSLGLLMIAMSALPARAQAPTWAGYARDPQHSTLSTVASKDLNRILWQTSVDGDTASSSSGGDLYIHYGSPMVTAANTVIVPTKLGANSFEVQAINGSTGAVMWTQTTDYRYDSSAVGGPPFGWTPSYSPTLTPTGGMFYPGAGGTLYYRDNLNSSGNVAPTQLAFYDSSGSGLTEYNANKSAFNSSVYIDTPLTSDASGNVYFGFQVDNSPPAGSGLTTGPGLANAQGGIAKLSYNSTTHAYSASYVTAAAASGDASMSKPVMNAAPALSPDSSTVYVAVNQGNYTTGSSGYLLALNSSTLATQAKVIPQDPQSHSNATITDQGSASPTVGPDGDVYYGTLDNFGTSRGWMNHYQLTPGSGGTFSFNTSFAPGGFGWDDTDSIVPALMVPSYKGASKYLLMTKYNNYRETGGGGRNMIALLDPNDTMVDLAQSPSNPNGRNNPTGATIMKVVMEIESPTTDSSLVGFTEWCDNNAVVDPLTDSVLITNEDGKLYRWNLTTDTLTQSLALGAPLGQAYTPTLIGPNGTVFAINDGTLFAVVPEPSTLLLAVLGMGLFAAACRRKGERRV